MPFGMPRPLRPGEQPSVADFNAMAEAVAQMGESSNTYGSDLSLDRSNGGVQVNDHATPGHWAKITGVTTGMHSHVEVTPDGVALASGQGYYGTATTNGTPAREVNGQTAPTGTVVWLELDPFRMGWVFSLGSTGGGGGFYAALSGSSSPYSFGQVDGPNFGASGTAGGKSGTANATELLTGLAGIPAGTVVWMTPTPSPAVFFFQCLKLVVVKSWKADPAAVCSIVPAETTTYYLSAANLCARSVDAVLA